MKKLLFLLTLTAAVSCNTPQELAVMTLNMRYDNPEDGMNNWRFRRERIAGLIRSEAVDLLGTQEVLANQFDDLQALLPGYRAVGVGREDGARAGEFNAVFFRSDRFELLDSGVFWLSEEPETPGSKGWDGACERLATWTVLRDKSGGELLFINTHLDHIGEQARREGVALLLRRIETLRAGRPVILTGDFNAESSSPVIAHVVADSTLRSAWDTAPERNGVELLRFRAASGGGASVDRLRVLRRRPGGPLLLDIARHARRRIPLRPCTRRSTFEICTIKDRPL